VRRAGRDVSDRHLRRLSLPKRAGRGEALAAEGIEAEVIDLRVLRPLDMAIVLASVRARAACWWSTKAGAAAAWPPR
jgi:pyruvate/2-oxoglutarate/acetoin dehydrogenase E1 component